MRKRDNYNAYMAEYMRNRYHTRRKETMALLGGKCAICASEDSLQFDHINPEDKSFSVGRMWSIKHECYLKEVSKCQLLCETCHSHKHQQHNHGNRSMYNKGCRCALCREAANKYSREFKRRASITQLEE